MRGIIKKKSLTAFISLLLMIFGLNYGCADRVDNLILQLKDQNATVRRHSARTLGEIGPPKAINPLVNVLRDQNAYVREAAAVALLRIAEGTVNKRLLQPAINPLIEALKDKDELVRFYAVSILGETGDPKAVIPLIEALKPGDPKGPSVHWAAAEALGKIGDPKAVIPLIEALKDQNAYVRETAASVLGKVAEKAVDKGTLQPAVEHLINALKDQSPSVRGSAASALGRIGEKRGIDSAVTVLINDLMNALKDQRQYVRFEATAALRNFAEKSDDKKSLQPAINPLIEALKDQDSGVRSNAIQALGKIGDSKATELLIETLKDQDPNVRRDAAIALGEIGDSKAIELLSKALKDRNAFFRSGATIALGEIGDPKSVSLLIEALKDQDSGVRRDVAEVLGKIGDLKAINPLIDTLKDQVPDVRKSAAYALSVIARKTVDKRLLQPAINPLIEALKDKDSRYFAAEALGMIGDKHGIELAVTAMLNNLKEDRKDEDYHVYVSGSRFVTSAVTGIGKPAVDLLIVALKNEDEDVRENAAGVLGHIMRLDDVYEKSATLDNAKALVLRTAVIPLIEALKDQSPSVRGSVVFALGYIGDPKAVIPLIEALKDRELYPRRAAAYALGEMAEKAADKQSLSSYKIAVYPLIVALKDQDSNVRSAASEALGKIGDPKAVNPLIDALKDQDPYVRDYAAKALGRIGDERAITELKMTAEEDAEEFVRTSASEAVGKIAKEDIEEFARDAVKEVPEKIEVKKNKSPSYVKFSDEERRIIKYAFENAPLETQMLIVVNPLVRVPGIKKYGDFLALPIDKQIRTLNKMLEGMGLSEKIQRSIAIQQRFYLNAAIAEKIVNYENNEGTQPKSVTPRTKDQASSKFSEAERRIIKNAFENAPIETQVLIVRKAPSIKTYGDFLSLSLDEQIKTIKKMLEGLGFSEQLRPIFLQQRFYLNAVISEKILNYE